MVRKESTIGKIAPGGILLALLIAACRPGLSDQPARCPAGTRDEELSSGGIARQYRIFVPASYRQGKTAPLVLGFHGNGSNTAQIESYTGFSTLAAREGFIAVYPQGAGQFSTWDTWAGSQDVQFIRDLIETVAAQCSIDRNRIFAVGFSRGGGMANRLACDLSDRIAAIGSVSGTYLYAENCSPGRPVPIVAFHGTADQDVPYNGIGNGAPSAYFNIGTPIPQWAAAWAERDECGAEPAAIFQQGPVTGRGWQNCRGGADVILYTIDGGGHEWPSAVDATGMIWNFFVAHPLPSDK